MIKKLVILLFISSLGGCGLFSSDSSTSDPYVPNYTPNYKANYTPNFKPYYGTGIKSGS